MNDRARKAAKIGLAGFMMFIGFLFFILGYVNYSRLTTEAMQDQLILFNYHIAQLAGTIFWSLLGTTSTLAGILIVVTTIPE